MPNATVATVTKDILNTYRKEIGASEETTPIKEEQGFSTFTDAYQQVVRALMEFNPQIPQAKLQELAQQAKQELLMPIKKIELSDNSTISVTYEQGQTLKEQYEKNEAIGKIYRFYPDILQINTLFTAKKWRMWVIFDTGESIGDAKIPSLNNYDVKASEIDVSLDFQNTFLFIFKKTIDDQSLNNWLIPALNRLSKEDNKYSASAWNLETKKQIKKEIIQALAAEWKIHLQVKREYLLSFVYDLLKLLNNDEELKDNIPLFKVTNEPFGFNTYIPNPIGPYQDIEKYDFKNKNPRFQKIPTIVLYLKKIKLEPNEQEKLKHYLDPIIKKLVDRYKYVDAKIALHYDEIDPRRNNPEEKNVVLRFPAPDPRNNSPRFNQRITDLIHITGGDGTFKFNKLLSIPKPEYLETELFTDDLSYFRGYEYKYTPGAR